MASSPKLTPFFILITLLFLQISARESHFFSKVSPTTTTVNPSTTTTNGQEGDNFKKQEQEPTFTQETQSGYGLYGQEATGEQTQFPTTTKLGNAPYTTGTTYVPYRTQETHSNNNQYYSNNNAYNQEQDNFGQNGFQESNNRYQPMNNPNNNYRYNYNGGNTYSNNGRQGMSDTRYLENGKYYYDIKNEKNYYASQHQNPRTSSYETSASYNNNNANHNNVNPYEFQENFEEFPENQEEQFVP